MDRQYLGTPLNLSRYMEHDLLNVENTGKLAGCSTFKIPALWPYFKQKVLQDLQISFVLVAIFCANS